MSTRSLLFLILLAFAVTLAVVVGTRLPVGALPIVLGVSVGLAIGIPTSVLLGNLTRHAALDLSTQRDWEAPASGSQTAPGANGRRTSSGASLQASSSPVSERTFTVVGGATPPLFVEEDFPGNGDHR